jgi:hypothetical protein
VLTPEEVAHFVLVLIEEVVYVLCLVVVIVVGQRVEVTPVVVKNEVVDSVAGQGLS